MTNLKNIEKLANTFNNDIELVNKRLKTLASQKSRLLPQKGRKDYNEKMNEILSEYQALTEVKRLIEPKKKSSLDLTQDDINMMTFDEVKNMRNNIASHMSRTRHITEIPGDNDEYRHAKRIDDMLKERERLVKPIEDTVIRKSDVQMIIDTIKAAGNLSNERIIELLEGLI